MSELDHDVICQIYFFLKTRQIPASGRKVEREREKENQQKCLLRRLIPALESAAIEY